MTVFMNFYWPTYVYYYDIAKLLTGEPKKNLITYWSWNFTHLMTNHEILLTYLLKNHEILLAIMKFYRHIYWSNNWLWNFTDLFTDYETSLTYDYEILRTYLLTYQLTNQNTEILSTYSLTPLPTVWIILQCKRMFFTN